VHKVVNIVLAGTLLLGFGMAQSEEEPAKPEAQIFAISAETGEVTAEISKLPGIAPYYHLYDVNGNPIEVIPNPFLDKEFGIGPAAAAMLADKGVTVLIGRKRPGPNMMDVLDERQVRLVRRIGTVQDVEQELKE
jgi:predicted Fe-Mo cluster-binding NifX family protein